MSGDHTYTWDFDTNTEGFVPANDHHTGRAEKEVTARAVAFCGEQVAEDQLREAIKYLDHRPDVRVRLDEALHTLAHGEPAPPRLARDVAWLALGVSLLVFAANAAVWWWS